MLLTSGKRTAPQKVKALLAQGRAFVAVTQESV